MVQPIHHRYHKYNVHETHTGYIWKSLLVFIGGALLLGLGINSLVFVGNYVEGLFYVFAGLLFMFPLLWKFFMMVFS